MITAFASPISDKIFMAYDTKHKHKDQNCQKMQESPLEHQDDAELNGFVFREFTIHIFQSISFLQTLVIDYKDIQSRMIDLKFKGPHRKVILFDLDETLAHCVRHKNLMKEPDVFLNVSTPTGKVLKAGFNIRPYCNEILI
jgi:hypothetical protein